MKITVIGTGYVGLVTGACLAEVGNDVLCVDVNQEKIALLQKGGIPIHEAGLEEIIQRNAAAGRLRFSTDLALSVEHGLLQLIAVGTPSDEDGSADLQYVLAAARNIGRFMREYRVIANKSTVPVGTADRVRETIDQELTQRNAGLEFSVVSNPEFLKEGAAVEDFMRPDRVIIGSDDERALKLMRSLYAPFQRNHERIITMDIHSAELTKYAANAMLATRISFMNELANLAERLGADIEEVRRGIGADPRIGYHFLYPGCGYGGSCLPKDVNALQGTALAAGMELKLLSAVGAVNTTQKRRLLEKIQARFGNQLQGKHFALWGLAFKPDTDDMREAPSRVIIDGLLAMGATLSAYDPVAMKEARRIYSHDPRISFAESPMLALTNADALIIVTEWREFRSPNFAEMKSVLKNAVIVDGRNLYPPLVLAEQGWEYHAIGRKGAC